MKIVLCESELPAQMLELLGDYCRVLPWFDADTDPGLLATAEGLLTYGHPAVGAAEMDLMPNLRVISNFGVGVDHIVLPAAQERGIAVGNTPGFVDHATADMTMALVLSIARNVVTGDHYARSAEFTTFDPNILHGADVHGGTIGIVGMGAIGKKVARRAAGFEMNILYHNRKPDPQAEAQLGARYVSLPELLAQSDFVTLNVPLTADTHNLISDDQLRQMKPGAYLVNVARGAVVDHDALVRALAQKQIAGAALDVTEPEPLPRDHPLLEMPNAIILPHLGSAARQTRAAMGQRTVENLLAGLELKELPSRVV